MLQHIAVVVQFPGVLHISRAHAAYGRHTEPHQITIRPGAVALEIAVQTALSLGHGQAVVGQGEMVHAYVHISCVLQHLQGHGKHAGFVLACGQSLYGNMPLRFEAGWQMRVTVHRQPVGAQGQDTVQSALPAGQGLQRQAVNQIQIDGAKTCAPRCLHQTVDGVNGLHAIDRLLHLRVKILHAQTDAVESHGPQAVQSFIVNRARVHLYSELAAGLPMKSRLQ